MFFHRRAVPSVYVDKDPSSAPTTKGTDSKEMTVLKECTHKEELKVDEDTYDDVGGERVGDGAYEPINESSMVDDGMYELSSYPDTLQKGNLTTAVRTQAEEEGLYDSIDQ